MARRGVPVLYGYSPWLVPEPADWKGAAVVCGYWFADSPSAWVPSAELLAFLQHGPPPLYVGFGSMASEDPGRMEAIVVEALEQTGQRAILASGWGGLPSSALPPGLISVDYIPHEWLFGRVSGAVHHGGAGTTAAALRAGIPSIIIPFFADQFFWGRRLHERGLSPRPIPRTDLSAQRLACSIREIVGDGGMRERCRAAGEAIRSERGVAIGAEAADRYLRSVTRARIH
jgi:sterol 3beta-glucosyltransferase